MSWYIVRTTTTRKQIRVEIIIPLNYNNGKPIPDRTLTKVYDIIQEKFGGLSKESSVIYGNWRDPATKKVYNDINRKIWIDCDATMWNIRYLKRLRTRLKRILKQEAIYIKILKIQDLEDIEDFSFLA